MHCNLYENTLFFNFKLFLSFVVMFIVFSLYGVHGGTVMVYFVTTSNQIVFHYKPWKIGCYEYKVLYLNIYQLFKTVYLNAVQRQHFCKL